MGKLAITSTAQFDVEPNTAIITTRIEQYDYDYARCADDLTARTLVALAEAQKLSHFQAHDCGIA